MERLKEKFQFRTLPKTEHWAGYLITAIVAVRYVLNISGGVTMDEVFYAQSGLSMFHFYMYGNPTHMHAPLVKYLIGLSQILFGVSETSIRIPIAIIGVIATYATYRVGRYIFDRTTGVIAAALLALIHPFNYYATMAMLDVPLALFVTLVFAATVAWFRDQSPNRALLALGFFTVAAGATKVQGALYVIGAVVIVGWILTREVTNWSDKRATMMYYFGAAAASFAIIYAPFAFSPAPTYYGGANPPQFAQTLFQIPWIGGIAFAFAAAVVHNLTHLGHGHEVILLGKTYLRPPAWSFLVWMLKFGGIPILVGLATIIYSMFDRKGERGIQVAIAGLFLIPLLIHMVLSVKLPRYLVPMYPILAIFAGRGIQLLAAYLNRSIRSISGQPESGLSKIVVVFAILIILISTPPSLAASTTETIRTDTGADNASEMIIERSNNDRITVVASNPLVYRWYFGQHRVYNYSQNVHSPRVFSISRTQIELVGVKYRNVQKIIDQESTCFIVVSISWLHEQPTESELRKEIESMRKIAQPGEYIVYDACTKRDT